MTDNLHKNHRKRVKEEFLSAGFSDATPEHKILEMLLFFSIPRMDTNKIAHNLINHFGSLSKVIDAPVSDLVKIEGVGENTASLLKLMLPIISRYNLSKINKPKSISKYDEIFDYVLKKYLVYSKETFAVTTFNAAGVFCGFDVIDEGEINQVGISMRNLVERVIARQATAAIISHNHPNGTAMPSADDIKTTIDIKDMLEGINVKLLDHIIIADGDGVSLRQSNRYSYIFK